MRIGDFASQLGVSVRVLRHYESSGLLNPIARDSNGYRMYSEEQLVRARQIRDLVATGLPTRLVRELVDTLTESGGIHPLHIDTDAASAIEDEWERMCRCVDCMIGRRDALRAYLDSLGR